MLLSERPAAHGVVLGVLHARGVGVGALALADLLVAGEDDGALRRFGADIGRAAYVVHGRDVLAALEPARYLYRGVLAHAVGQQVGLGVEDDAAAHLVLPVVVVGKAPEARLQRAYYDRQPREGLAGAVGVDGHRAVGAQPHLFAGGVEVLAAAVLAGGVVRDHAVQVARAYHDAKARPAHGREGLGAVPVGLAEHGHAEALGLQHAGYDRRAEAGVVDIGVPADDEEVVPPPAARVHVLGRDGQKIEFSHSSSP